MNLLILGSTGGTGQQLVKQALEQNHTVTALARTPEKLPIKHGRLTVVKGDVLDEKTLSELVEKKDAILSTLGVTKSLRAHGLITNAVGLIVKVMRAHNLKRFIIVSAFGVG
jgi:putative NADH-flavin reductase